MLLLLLSVLFAAGMTFGSPKKTTYLGYKVLRAIPASVRHVDLLDNLKKSNPKIDFWSDSRALNKSVDLMVRPKDYNKISSLFNNVRMGHSVLIHDVQKLIDENEQHDVYYRTALSKTFSFKRFNRLDEIYSWMHKLTNKYPDIAKVISIGETTEGRDLLVLKISDDSIKSKPAIWIDGGIHPREWISPATATYIIDQLLNNSTNNYFVQHLDWYILPVMNPDGYEFTHTNSRLWRKTRSPASNGCIGTDANRNWGFHWDEGGASSNPCSTEYKGQSAFSEPETKYTSDYIWKNKDNLKAYLTLHCYGQLWMTPWGYTVDVPSDYADLVSLAEHATKALSAVYGTRFKIGSSTNILYVASGGSDDWAKGVAGIKYVYTVELRDTGYYGFVLPGSMIKPAGRETFEAIKVVANQVIEEFG